MTNKNNLLIFSVLCQATCTVVSTNTLDFGSNGLLNANIDVTADFTVLCSNTIPYDLGLDAGTSAGGTIATRKMINTGVTVDYTMFRDAGRTLNWGETVSTDTKTGTGSGADQVHTINPRERGRRHDIACFDETILSVRLNPAEN